MTSLERVMLALNHQEPDRVPLDFDCSQADKVEDVIRYYGKKTKEELLRHLGVDLRWCVCWDDVCASNRYDARESFVDLWGVKRSGFGMFPVSHPLARAETIDDLEAYPHWPAPDAIDYEARVREMEQHRDCAVLGGMWSCFIGVTEALLGTEKYMMMFLVDPNFTHHLLDRICAFYMESNRRMFEAAGKRMHIFHMGDDYGAQRGLLWSPAVWREFVKPRLKRLYDQAHAYGYKVFHHSCGGISEIVPELVELGLDCLQPIQCSAANMDPGKLKARYGGTLCFMGAVDAQRVLPFGTPGEVEREVKTRIGQLAKGGGYILSTSQGILPETPNDNIRALYDAAHRYGASCYARGG